MKKLLVFCFALAMFFMVGSDAFSQSSFKTASGGLITDTLTDAETLYLTHYADLNTLYSLGIVATADTLTGTDATVTVTLQVSLDNVKWADYAAATTIITTGGVAENSVPFNVPDWTFRYLRLKFTQTGTATTLVWGKFYPKRK